MQLKCVASFLLIMISASPLFANEGGDSSKAQTAVVVKPQEKPQEKEKAKEKPKASTPEKPCGCSRPK